MAIGWLTLLKTVPWSDVISNAPKVADGAKKLWKAVAKRPSGVDVRPGGATAALSPDNNSSAAMASRIAALEQAASDLQGQMLASSELIKALAEQNAQLIKRMERNRTIVLWLTGICLVALLAAMAAMLLNHAG